MHRDLLATEVFGQLVCLNPKESLTNDVMFSMFVGNVPLIPLFEMYNSRAFEKVVENQFGSESNIDALDISSTSILVCDCSQEGNEGPKWQDRKDAV